MPIISHQLQSIKNSVDIRKGLESTKESRSSNVSVVFNLYD